MLSNCRKTWLASRRPYNSLHPQHLLGPHQQLKNQVQHLAWLRPQVMVMTTMMM